jgi:DNA-binding transcriptional ArsR family regulator
MSLAGASKHIRVLESAELISRRVSGRTHYCRLEAARLAEAQAWLKHYERFWTRAARHAGSDPAGRRSTEGDK